MSPLGRCVAALTLPLVLGGCFSTRKRAPFDYAPFVASDPRSVVVAPLAGGGPQQRQWLVSLITRPLAERGYYVLPVRMTQSIAAQEGLPAHRRKVTAWYDMNNSHGGSKIVEDPGDAEQIRRNAVDLAAYFGADSVLFVQILDWGHGDRLGQGFSNLIDPEKEHSVGLDYILADRQGRTIWRATKHIVHRRGGGDLITEVWNASTKPSDADIDSALAREANWWMITGQRLRTPKLWYYYSDPVLVGPYHPGYNADRVRRRGAISSSSPAPG